jgi:hypothetical protein
MALRAVCPDDVGLLGQGDCTRDCGGWRSVLNKGPRSQCCVRVRYHVVLLISPRRNGSRVDRIAAAWCVVFSFLRFITSSGHIEAARTQAMDKVMRRKRDK